MLQELDVVRLKSPLPDLDLPLGTTGTIVMAYDGRNFEVEFTSDDGDTLGLVTTDDDHVEAANLE